MTILTKKFSQFTSGGDLENNNLTVGLEASLNTQFNNPWVFLPPGNTGDRPPITAAMFNRLRFNTTFQEYEYYNSGTAAWVQLNNTGVVAGPFVIYEADPSLPTAFNLGSLTSGLLKQTVSLGVSTPATAIVDTDYYGPGMSGYMRAPAGIQDSTGAIVFSIVPIGTSVNYLAFSNNATLNNPIISVNGTDATIGLSLRAKGAAPVSFETTASSPAYTFRSGTSMLHVTNFIMSNTIASRDVTWQDASGTVAYLTDIPGGSPSALTRVDDTNITITLGGTPSTALLQAVSLTMGWSGTLATSRGGLGQGTAPSDGQIPIGNSGIYTPGAISSGTGILVGNAPGAITVSLAPIATLNLLANLTGGSAAPTAHTLSAIIDACIGSTQGNILYRNASIWTVLAPGVNGQLLQSLGPAANIQWVTSSTVTPAAMTRTDDTNVTLTLGGTPASSLLQPVSLTLGWTGTLAETRGGTAQSTYTTGDTLYASAANTLSKLAGNITTAKQYLSQTGSGAASAAPAWAAISGADITGAALTKTDDTNVTLTLGGTPTTALLRATSLTLGWTGQLSLTRGGTNANLTASNGGIVYSDASAMAILAGTATAGQIIRSGASAAPSWSTSTYPATNAVSTLLYASSANVMAALPTANDGVLITSGSGVPSISSTLPTAVLNNISGRLKSFQIFTSGTAATYTRPSGVTSILVECVGGGGGGGGSAGAVSSIAVAGGGGAGGYVRLWVAAAASSYTYTVGPGGAGATAGNNTGTTGTATTFSASSLSAGGGVGGTGGAAALTSVSAIGGRGGLGGSGTNGDINMNGGYGGYGISILTNATSGGGGRSFYGSGAQANAVAGTGNAAAVYGAGGAGGLSTTTDNAGGAGSAGIIIVWEFS